MCPANPHHAGTTHHILPRALGGKNGKANLVRLCQPAHTWVHLNPHAARQRGLIEVPKHFRHSSDPLPDCPCRQCRPYKKIRRWWPAPDFFRKDRR